MKKRTATLTRETKETKVVVALTIDGQGTSTIDTGIGFLDHMLELLTKQGLFNLKINVPKSDLQVDEHHTVEDVGITLGQTLARALGEKVGINRYGFFILPMDEALVEVAVDLSGRSYLAMKDSQGRELKISRKKIGDFPTELLYDFLQAFAENLKANLHLTVRSGRNAHHIIEAIFKCLGRALRLACEIDPRARDQVPSTKGKI